MDSTAEAIAKRIRHIVLAESKRAHVGHIGSCLCVADILAVLYGGVLRIASPEDPDRDRFILSKGHAGLALFAALRVKGWISDADIATFCGDNSLLGVHPDAGLRGVDFSTGSLGHGLSMAVGAALAARLQGSGRRVYCLISDAECNEGSVWEAAMFAAHHRLDNLTAILDWNGQQAFGRTRDVLDCPNLGERWHAFGWRTSEVDGHSFKALAQVMAAESRLDGWVPPLPGAASGGPCAIEALAGTLDRAAPGSGGAPHIVLARTTFGKGVSYMEQGVALTQNHLPVHPVNWHYLPMSDAEYRIAVAGAEPPQ